MKKLIVDIDDTSLKYAHGLFDFIGVDYPHGKEYGSISDYLVGEHGYTNENVWNIIEDFNTSEGFRHLTPLNGSDKVLKKLHDEGVKISVISSCGDTKTTKENRYYNLYKVFGNIFESITMLPLGARKTNSLLQFIDRDPILIEDTLTHYNDAIILGMDSYIVKGELNATDVDQSINHFVDWNEFYKLYHSIHK